MRINVPEFSIKSYYKYYLDCINCYNIKTSVIGDGTVEFLSKRSNVTTRTMNDFIKECKGINLIKVNNGKLILNFKPNTVSSLKELKGVSGIYRLYKINEVVYVGVSNNIGTRVAGHKREGVKDFDEFDYYPTLSMSDAYVYEMYYIAIHKGFYNKESKSMDELSVTLPSLMFSDKISK